MAITGMPKKPKPMTYLESLSETILKPDSPNVFDSDAICYQLEHPSEIVLNAKGEMYWLAHRKVDTTWLYNNSLSQATCNNYSTQIFCAPPVLMALCVQRYDLVYDLVEAGYSAVFDEQCCIPDELQGNCVIQDVSFPFTIGQFIMGDPDMPDNLRLFLWHQIAQEKGEASKVQKKPRNKVIDFWWINFEENFCACIFGSHNEKSNRYFMTFMNTLDMIATGHKRYLKNIIGGEWRNILSYREYRFYEKIMCLLLDKVVVSERQKLRLLQLGCIESTPNLYISMKDLEKAVDFLYRIEPHFQSELLQKTFFTYILKIYMHYKSGTTYIGENARRQKVEDRFVCLIRKYGIKDFSLYRFLLLHIGKEVIASDWFGKLLQLYKTLTGRKVILDESICIVEETLGLGQQRILKTDNNTVTIALYEDSSWVEYVDQYSYSDQKGINTVQEYILKRCGQDMLLSAMRRNLFRGKQFDLAIDYCLKDQNLQSKVPCILAYKKWKKEIENRSVLILRL